jgi:hypothetical protein
MTLSTLIVAFHATPTLANAKAIVAYLHDHPTIADLHRQDAAAVRKAKAIVADAKDPAKIREAMQTELRARYKNLNITVI